MYMGLIKRGLFVLVTFFLCIYLAGIFNFFGFVIAGVVITSFFDGLRIRRKFITGDPVSDDIDDLKAFFAAYKTPIIGVTALLVVMEFVQNTARWAFRGGGVIHHGVNPQAVAAIAVIALGVYLLSKSRKGKKSKDRDLQ